MWRLALLLVLASAASGQDGSACERDFPTILEDIQNQIGDGQDVRDRLLARIDRILERDRGQDTECLLTAREQRVVLTNVSERYAESVHTADQALRSGAARTHIDVASGILRNKAIALEALGRQVEASQAYTDAAGIAPRLSAAKAVGALNNLANNAIAHGDFLEADAAQRRALRILRDSAAADPARMRVRTGRLLTSRAYLFQQRLAQTTDPTSRAETARRLVAVADTAAAILSAYQTDDPTEQAFDEGKRALALIDGAYGEAVLGHHVAAARRIDAAKALATPKVQAILPYLLSDLWLRRAETEQMAGHLEAASAAAETSRTTCRESEDVSCEAAAVERMALIAEVGGRTADAEEAYRRATVLRDIEWEQGRLQDWSASAFATAQTPYRGLARVLVRAGRAAEALTVLDGARARTLRDMRARLEARAGLTPARQARIDSLLAELETERLSLLETEVTVDEQAAVAGRVAGINAQIDAETRSETRPLAPLDVAALQTTLRREARVLVSYLVDRDQTVAFVVTPDTLVARVLPTTASAVQTLLHEAGGAWSSGAVRLEPLHALHERLVRPLRDLLPESGSLVVVPDGPLADLPFGALVEAPADGYASARFLARRYAISTDLAAALLVADAERPEGAFPVDLLAFGRSTFGETAEHESRRGGPVLIDLPNVIREIARVRAQVGNRETALNGDATEARFDREAGKTRILHVASHAEADAAFPLYSRFYLWDDPEADDDGIVHLFELQSLRLPAELVVLSGCSTAAGEQQSGEGTIGLQYGVRAAGAAATLATLWPVDDRATTEIMDAFYAGLAEGLPKDEALQRAQVGYVDRHAGAEASPWYWAAPVLSGDPRPLPLHPPRPVWPWILGGLAMAAGAGGLAWRRRSSLRLDA